MIKRFDMSAYCYRCGSAEGSNAVVIDHDEDKNGNWVRYEDYEDEKLAMCEANSNAMLADVRALKETIEAYKECFEKYIPVDKWDEATIFLSTYGSGLAKDILWKES